ncbi:MAG: electron transfer flavoprotein subunit beta/FixA family protein [Candidatus Methanomethylicus sp.]|nr:electron transfer flavoprotein subunit beta/FixA family protein [Candidatus Methanomethylicus sp.]
MEIVVCIKQVPETTNINWDPRTGTLIREGVPGILNPNDKNVLETALQLKEKHGGSITALSMGPAQAEEALREALSMGIDKAILLSDRRFAGADTLATAYALSLALKKIPKVDLIVCGEESADGMTGQVGPQVAEFFDIPQLTYATEIEIHGHTIRIKQKLEDCHRILESSLPALITVERGCNIPRIPSMEQIMEAYRDKEVLLWGTGDLEGNSEHFGLIGSPTQCRRVYIYKAERRRVQRLEGKTDEVARKLIQLWQQNNLI